MQRIGSVIFFDSSRNLDDWIKVRVRLKIEVMLGLNCKLEVEKLKKLRAVSGWDLIRVRIR